VIVDAHQHIWDPARARYDWLTGSGSAIERPFGIDEAIAELRSAGIDRTVLVQAADNDEDTELMLEAAAAHREVAGVVAYVPLERPQRAAERLAQLRANPVVVGVRALIHDQPDPDWLLRPDVDEGLGVLEAADVPFDLVAVLPRHLEVLGTVGERHPGLRIVIDHLSKPPIGLAEREPWWSLIARSAENPRVFAKVSGLYSATADPAAWTPEQVAPYFERAVEVFGPGRLMYGGDWPVSITAGGYARTWAALSALAESLGPDGRDALLHGTAQSFYGLTL
jgi:L-fuconolactonase